MLNHRWAAIVLCLGLTACIEQQVTRQELNRQVALTRQQYESTIEDLRSEVNRLRASTGECETLRSRLAELERSSDQLQSRAAALERERDALRDEIETLRQMKDEAARLEVEAREIRERAEALQRERDEIRTELQKFIDLGAIGVEATTDGVLITMREAILFDSGKADLKASSAELLAKIAQIVLKSKAREIRIGGHTDNMPIRTDEFPSNWELSAARAMSVLHRLADTHRVPPQKLAAMGFGQYKPVASNISVDGRAKNRRVEIYLVPDER